jgi:glycosyltransferase involved in cell wall biosynthesis
MTINFNNAFGLRKTIESVVTQTFSNYEYIIIDGGSNDGSADVIKKNSDIISYWVSESDKGIYNAMNKGIKAARGEYLLFLNSGDSLIDENILSIVFSRNHTEDFLYGDCMVLDNETGNNSIWKKPEVLDWSNAFTVMLNHQSMFIKRDLLTEEKYNETEYKIIADWAHWFKHIYINNASYYYLNRVISLYDTSGISSQADGNMKMYEDKIKFYIKYADIIIPKLVDLNHQLTVQDRTNKDLEAKINGSFLLKNTFRMMLKVDKAINNLTKVLK